MVKYRRVHTNWIIIEDDRDAQTTNKVHVAMTGSLIGCSETLSFLKSCLPNLQEMTLHVPFVHYGILGRIQAELTQYLAEGGEHGPVISVVIPDGVFGHPQTIRGRVPSAVYWLLHTILENYSVAISMRYVHVHIDEVDVINFVAYEKDEENFVNFTHEVVQIDEEE